MLVTILIACLLVAVTVAIHSAGLVWLLRSLTGPQALLPTRFWPMVRLLVLLTWALILVHLSEVAVWAFFYLWARCMPDVESAFYFSGVTYATVGYGDLVLSPPWRMLGPVEGLTAILMCGLSTGFYFAVLTRIFQSAAGPDPE
jgi:Ion channel